MKLVSQNQNLTANHTVNLQHDVLCQTIKCKAKPFRGEQNEVLCYVIHVLSDVDKDLESCILRAIHTPCDKNKPMIFAVFTSDQESDTLIEAVKDSSKRDIRVIAYADLAEYLAQYNPDKSVASKNINKQKCDVEFKYYDKIYDMGVARNVIQNASMSCEERDQLEQLYQAVIDKVITFDLFRLQIALILNKNNPDNDIRVESGVLI